MAEKKIRGREKWNQYQKVADKMMKQAMAFRSFVKTDSPDIVVCMTNAISVKGEDYGSKGKCWEIKSIKKKSGIRNEE